MGKFSKKKNVSNIHSDKFLKILSIFEEKKWSIENKQYSDGIFDDFCSMLSKYNDEQQTLIIELAEKFLWVGINEYPSYLKSLFEQIASDKNNIIDKSKTIIIIPLSAPEDFGKVKSSSFLTYLIKGDIVHIERMFTNKKIMVLDNYNWIIENKNQMKNSIIFLVDDYVGTGETAESAINYLIEQGLVKSELFIATLFSQQSGYEKIIEDKINIYCSEIRKKGITDFYTEEEVARKLNIMESIEKIIKVKPKYKFGYGQSEALISLTRTPNNTFPVYWLECKKIPIVPFARRG